MSDVPEGEAINTLLRSAHDSADGFRQGASRARSPLFRSLFEQRLDARTGLIHTLEGEVTACGEEPVRDGTMVGEANRFITVARDLLARESDKGLVAEIARRESLVAQNFARVADDPSVSEAARRIAAGALEQLTTEQRELAALSDQFR